MLTCIIPAAGESKRFPWNKLLYTYSDKPLIIQTIENIVKSGFIDNIVLVLGYQSDLIMETLKKDNIRNIHIVYNPEYHIGMSSSIRKGIEYIVENWLKADGIVINPADAAWIHPGIYAYIAVKYYEYMNRYDIVVAACNGRRGHPIIFAPRLISDLLNITEEKQGIREITSKYQYSTLIVETSYPGVILDLDNIHDLLRVKSLLYV
ncbi:MAG: nucleotidyltransferase family protein [Desulfurococcaceae archaeon]